MGGFFERKVNMGMDFLRMNGATQRAHIKIIMGHPSVERAVRATDFVHLQISMVNREKRLNYRTQNYPYTDGNWLPPTISEEDEKDWQPWDPQDDYISLEEAVVVAHKAGWCGPWEILSVYCPRNDPISGLPAREPFYGFHMTRIGPYAVVGMRSKRFFRPGSLDPGILLDPEGPGVTDLTEVTT